MIYSLSLHLHSTKGTERTPFKFAPVDATGRPSFTTLPLSLVSRHPTSPLSPSYFLDVPRMYRAQHCFSPSSTILLSLSLPFLFPPRVVVDTGGGPRHNIPLFAPSLYPSSPFPLVMIATLRCTRLQKLCTTGGGGGGSIVTL